MPIAQTSLIEVRWTATKGRGVFAKEFIPRETIFERAPVLVMPAAEVLGTEDDTMLSHYLFEWGKGTVALALGFGSLYNHSYSPNARYEDEGRQMKLYISVRDIQPGEEVTVNYNGFAEASDPVWFDVVENPEKNGRKSRSTAGNGKKSNKTDTESKTDTASSGSVTAGTLSVQSRSATPNGRRKTRKR